MSLFSKKGPQPVLTFGGMGALSEKDKKALMDEEERTHRYLLPTERTQPEDIYGGADWKFLFNVGRNAGALAGNIGYRVRRKK